VIDLPDVREQNLSARYQLAALRAQAGGVSIADLLRPRRHLLAWTAPVAVVAVVAGGVALGSATSASGHPSLPTLTPAHLLAKVEAAKAPALSGVVQETARLGLPDLPGADQSASLSWTSLITGTHTAKVWLDGADKQRVALLGTLSEADVVHNGRDLWTYTSGSNAVSHTVLPADKASRHRQSDDKYTPIAGARALLKAVRPSTAVGVDQTQVVAGRDAYTLVISPRDRRSTIREVTIAVDSTRFVPLQLTVFGAGSTPVFQLGFTQVSFATPKPSTFNFHAPAGSTVDANPLQDSHLRDHRGAAPPSGRAPAETAAPKVLGSGWTTVMEFPDGLPMGASGGLLDRLTIPTGTSGERLLSTALINGVLLPDGRAFVGAVTPATLEHLAASTPR
jgi:outer membrane lipoprotein-sorting protein